MILTYREKPVGARLMEDQREYISEPRTERFFRVDCDGAHTVILCKGIASAVLCEAGRASGL